MMRRQQQQQNRHQDHQSKVLYEISALVLSLFRSPPTPIPLTDQSLAQSRRPPTSTTTNPITPAGFAWLMLGISLSLMLCGSVTFFIGFMLMPWVIGLVMVFYVVGIVSTISMLGRSILYSVKAPPSPRKEIPAWKLL